MPRHVDCSDVSAVMLKIYSADRFAVIVYGMPPEQISDKIKSESFHEKGWPETALPLLHSICIYNLLFSFKLDVSFVPLILNSPILKTQDNLSMNQNNTADNSCTIHGAGPILDDAAATLKGLYGDSLHGLEIERLVVGVFFTGVKMSNGCAGTAYTPPDIIRGAGNRILKSSTPAIRGTSAVDALDGKIPGPFSGVIRLAAINALSVPFFDSGRYRVDRSGDLSGIPSLFRGRRVCMVGAIIPLLKKLKGLDTAGVTIIDHKKETQEEAEAGYGTFALPEHTAEALAGCGTAVFTGAAIANGSIGGLMEMVPPDAAIVIVGPTAGFVPDALFSRRVAMVGTSVLKKSDEAMEILAEGGGGYRLFNECVDKINLLNLAEIERLGLEIINS